MVDPYQEKLGFFMIEMLQIGSVIMVHSLRSNDGRECHTRSCSDGSGGIPLNMHKPHLFGLRRPRICTQLLLHARLDTGPVIRDFSPSQARGRNDDGRILETDILVP